MVCGRNNGDENPRRICNSEEDVEDGPCLRFALLAWFEGLAENARVVHHCDADTEGVPKVHGWHGGKSVDVFPLHPNGLTVVVADAVEEAVFLGKKSRWHARVEDKDYERKEICKGHGSSDDGERVV